MNPLRWDVAREDTTCKYCGDPIAAGEQVRLMTPKNLENCVNCAKTRLDEDPPADMPIRPKLPKLKEPGVWAPDPITTLALPPPNIPALASTKLRERILTARRRLQRRVAETRTPLEQQHERRWWDR